MGRRRRNRNKRRSKRASQMAIQNMEKMAEESERYEQYKEAQNEYSKSVAQLEKDHLDRTIFVTHAINLDHSNNVEALRHYFSAHFGAIRGMELVRNKKRSRTAPPSARITFSDKSSAVAVLTKAKRNNNKVETSDVGYQGYLVVLPATPNGGGGIQSNQDDNVLTFQAIKLTIGDWISPHVQGSDPIQLDSGTAEDDSACKFIEGFSVKNNVSVAIDFRKRILTMQMGDEGADDLIPFSKTTFVIHWKNLYGSIEFCHEPQGKNQGYSLAFNVINPPKVYQNSIFDLNYSPDNLGERTAEFFGAPLKCCRGFRLHLPMDTARNLLQEKNHSQKLKDFGLISEAIHALYEAVPTKTEQVDLLYIEEILKGELKNVSDRKNSLLARAVVSNLKACWIHFVHDFVETDVGKRYFFDLIRSEEDYLVEKALEQLMALHGTTLHPAKFLYACIGSGGDSLVTDTDQIDTLPAYCMEVPRMLVTPTRVVVASFDVEVSNRVVRHFVNDLNFAPEDFIRVTFGDEDGSMIFSDEMGTSICERIRDCFLKGLKINGRPYQFLAYSSSQLKERSLWMVSCPTESWSVSRIRKWMGNFSSIRSPSKYGARMGQCFSTTVQAENTQRNSFGSPISTGLAVNDSLPDVIKIQGGYEWCHSDGTGIIEKEVALRILQKVPFCPRDPSDVSIIQVRFGGCKGTLMLWDMNMLNDCTCNKSLKRTRTADVYLRPSMIKFKAKYRDLEIVSIGAHVPYHLNRQMIMLLEVHGIPCSTFLKLQRGMLDDLDRMFESAKDAYEVLPGLSGPDSTTSSALTRMVAAGLIPRNEPFLFSCLHAIRSHHLMNLRKKSRIHIKKGAVLMGGLDETGLLPDHCVFLQVRTKTFDHSSLGHSLPPFEVITGPVLVAKHPVMHPGDVRMLYAVDIPQLHNHKNALVFSQQGIRAEPHKMAGSDLDGDQFAVSWDDRLFFLKWKDIENSNNINSSNFIDLIQKPNREPMMFDDGTKPEEVEEVLDRHLADHFIKHAKADSLGRISMLWLDWASKRNRADCEECLKLAELHSVAVDFPKSGIPAEIPKELRIPHFEARAHWREKKGAESYHCESTVGKLYDDVIAQVQKVTKSSRMRNCPAVVCRKWNQKGQLLSTVQASKERNAIALNKVRLPMIAAKLGLYTNEPGSHELDAEGRECLRFAITLREEYDEEMFSIMNKYKISSEGELVTGCIKKFHRLNKRRQHDLCEEIRRQFREIRNTTRKTFLYEVHARCNDGAQGITSGISNMSSENKEDDDEELISKLEEQVCGGSANFDCAESFFARKLAAACYEVTYSPEFRFDGQHNQINSCALYSFPWVFADIITYGLLAPSKTERR